MRLPAPLRDLRNRLVASARFQRLAARAWPLRPVARAQARALFDLSVAVALGQALAAAIELGLLDALADGAKDMAALSARLKLPPDGLQCLVVAAEGIGLVERDGQGRVALGMRGAAVRANPGIAAMVQHHRMLMADLADPRALFAGPPGGGQLARFWAYAGAPEALGDAAGAGEAGPYSALMAASQPMVAEQALAAYPFRRHRALLDIGGGSGAFLAAVGAAHPGLALTLFDLPAVIPHAAARLGDRARLVPGHFLDDALPTGADLVSLVRILHDHDDEIVAALLPRIRAILPPGGRLMIVEPMAGTPGAETVGSYFSLYLRAMGSGRPRTAAELRAMLAAAGFGRVREHATPLPLIARVLVAE
jgi:demethylspheroidene O-methyltransferase